MQATYQRLADRTSPSNPPGHPARGHTAIVAGLLACGSSPLRPTFPTPTTSVVKKTTEQLAAYSCGGSAGITPASLLAPAPIRYGEPRTRRSKRRRSTKSTPLGNRAARGPCGARWSDAEMPTNTMNRRTIPKETSPPPWESAQSMIARAWVALCRMDGGTDK